MEGELVMKKVWVSLGILLVASVAVYGVVSSVSASSAPKVVSAETSQSTGECPFSKQTAAADTACCSAKTADAGCCADKAGCEDKTACGDKSECSSKTAQTASAEGSCCSGKAKDEDTSKTAMVDGQ